MYGYQNIEKRIRYDYYHKKLNGLKEYRVKVYSNSASNASLWKIDLERFKKQLTFDAIYYFDGEIFSVKKILK